MGFAALALFTGPLSQQQFVLKPNTEIIHLSQRAFIVTVCTPYKLGDCIINWALIHNYNIVDYPPEGSQQ